MMPLRLLIAALATLLPVPQSVGTRIPLKRFEVIRISPEGIERVPPSVRPIFVDPLPDAELVANAEEAARKAGFTPRLPATAVLPGSSARMLRFGVTDTVRAEAKIGVAELKTALSEAKASGVDVPQAWDGISVGLQQAPGILVDYGDFFIAQAPPLTLEPPAGFPLDEFVEVLLRIAGMKVGDAGNIRQSFKANPAAFFPIPPRYDMDIREVKLTGGSGMLLQNADKGGELALLWSDSDRSYVLTGLMTETQAIAVANSVK
jgi:hypothetical protein